MKINHQSLLRRAFKDERGQVLPWVAFMMVLFLGMGAFVLDIGHGYYCYRELQAATDAAALAGAQYLNQSSPIAVATTYGAVAGSKNTNPNMPNVSMVPGYPVLKCLNKIKAMGINCVAPNNANAIQVKEQAIIPTFFARVLGINQMTLSSTSTAAILGAKATPLNVALLIDTTASMQTVDSNCGGERIVCALNGVQTLLQGLSPCSAALGCGSVSNGVATNPLDQVAVFTFPNVTVGSANDDYNCSGSNPSIPVYSLPTSGATTYAPTGSTSATYQVTPFMSDYRISDSASSLNTASDLSMVVGAGMKGGSSCPGMSAPGGDGTYYAGAIYAAQAALTAQATSEVASNPNETPQNIIIILTDGEANASASKMATKDASGNSISNSNTFPGGGGATSSLTNYPSTYDQCQQAVAAANYAKAQGTTIYAIAYGSESSGCTTDTSGPQAGITPCQVMSEMATSASYFYSDYNQSGSSSTCTSTGTSVNDMNGIFSAIVSGLLQVRLIPDSTT
jgi:Flp pilus assembly protein TadG